MANEGQQEAPKHRPLPSVRMALLSHELKASRSRHVGIAVGLLALVSGAATAAVGGPVLKSLFAVDALGGLEPMPEAKPPAPGAAPEGALTPGPSDLPIAVEAKVQAEASALGATLREPPVAREVKAFGKARGFRDALLRAGVSATDADGLVVALDKVIDFRRAQPEHELILERDSTGRLQGFEYRASITDRVHAIRQKNGLFRGARIDVPVERKRIARGGYISDSLGRALDALGLKNSLAGLFVEAFEGKIDFKKHAREGDSFKLIVEEQYVEGQLLGYGKPHALHYKGSKTGEALAFWFEQDGDGDFYDEHGRGLHGGWLRTPLRYDHISSPFNLRRKHPILKRIMPHDGIDYAASPGTAVWAAADGVATFVGVRGANGNLIALEHAGGYETYYAHLSRITRGIVRGARVRQRQPIGAVGSTGRSTGPHLHFALKRRGRFIDPVTQLNGPGKPLPETLQPKFKRHAAQLKRELASITLAAAPAKTGQSAEPADEFHDDPIDL